MGSRGESGNIDKLLDRADKGSQARPGLGLHRFTQAQS